MQVQSKLVDSDTKHDPTIDYIQYFKDNVNLRKRTVPELKRMSRENGLFVSGTKPLLIERIHKHFVRIKQVVYLQSCIRRNLVMFQLKLRGPGLLQNKRKLCINETDFYTLEPISEICPDDFFSYQDNKGFVYGFDIKSLKLMYDSQGSIMNPYNRYIFTGPILLSIKRLLGKPKSRTADDNEMETFDRMIELKNKLMETRITDIFYEIDRIGNYTVSSWFSQLSKDNYLNLFKRIQELWNYRAMLQDDIKQAICPYFDPFQFRLSRYSTYMHTPRERNLTIVECRKICVIAIENLIYTGRDDVSKNIIIAHILSALTTVSIAARNTMPWLHDSFVYLYSL